MKTHDPRTGFTVEERMSSVAGKVFYILWIGNQFVGMSRDGFTWKMGSWWHEFMKLQSLDKPPALSAKERVALYLKNNEKSLDNPANVVIVST